MIPTDLTTQSIAPAPPTGFEEAKKRALADEQANRINRVNNLIKLEKTATKFVHSGADPLELTRMVNQGRLAIANAYPDVPEYQKAATAAGRFRQMRQDPAEVVNQLPI